MDTSKFQIASDDVNYLNDAFDVKRNENGVTQEKFLTTLSGPQDEKKDPKSPAKEVANKAKDDPKAPIKK